MQTLGRSRGGLGPTVKPRTFYRPPPVGGGVAKRRRSLVGYLFLAPAIVYLLALFVYPIVYNVDISTESYSAVNFIRNTGSFAGLANYRAVFDSVAPTLSHVLIDTLLFVGLSLVFQYGIGLGLALFFSQRFHLSSLLRSLILVPWLIPPVVSGTILTFMFSTDNGMVNRILTGLGIVSQPIGWLDTGHLPLVTIIIGSIWIGIPFNMVLLHSGLQDIPKELTEAARVDGAGPIRTFRYVTMPMLRNVSAVVILLGIILTLKAFDQIWVMTGGGPANATQVLSTWSYTLSFSDLNFGQGAAVGNFMMAISLICAVAYVKTYGRRTLL